MEKRYKVIRFFRVSGRRKIILRNVSLCVAQLHCKSVRPRVANAWFDGYTADGIVFYKGATE